MKRKLIVIGLILILLLGGIWITRKYWILLFLNFEPRDPKIEIPITYNVGWWSNQDVLVIDSVTVEIIESKLNLFNSYSLLRYGIFGRLIDIPGAWEPKINKVHISERVFMIDSLNSEPLRLFHTNNDTSLNDTISVKPQAIIELTPIVSLEKRKDFKGKFLPFKITNEHKIQSLHWGNSYILFRCGGIEKMIVLKQMK